jgi:phage gp36-like protein
MPYAMKSDIIEQYGEQLLTRIADHDNDKVADDVVIDKALASAEELVNAYLSAQYTVPLVTVPGVVQRCTIDIAVYTMALQRAQRTDEMRLRYEDALALLKLMAKGEIGLGLPPIDTDDDDIPDTDPNATRKGKFLDWGRA